MTTHFRHSTNPANQSNRETNHNNQTNRETETNQTQTRTTTNREHQHPRMSNHQTNTIENFATADHHVRNNNENTRTTNTVTETTTVTNTITDSVFTALHPDLQKGIARNGFTTPTPIQQKAIPAAMQGRDILASSQTGSGKTAAFLLPIMHRIIESRENEKRTTGRVTPRTRVLILTPTRELAAQICQHFNELAQCTDLSCAAIFGGVSMLPQETAFRNSVDIMVATPGRLLDHMTRPYARLSHLEYLVLDEADRMLDMGFLPDIRRVLKALPTSQRQTLFFSATLPAPIVALTRDMLNNPVAVDVERPQITATGIEHKAFRVPENLKQELLINIIDQHQIRSAIIFTRTKHRAKRLASFLDRKNVATDFINGNRSQLQRIKALEDFRSGKVRVLVATDIASRGIDVEGISHVINFDVPHVVEDYVHRAGRTARASMTGYSYTLVSADEMYDFNQIERTIKTRIEQVKLENFDYNSKPVEALEVPLAQRIAEIRAYKSACRARATAKTARKTITTGTQTETRHETNTRTNTTQPRHTTTRTTTANTRSWQNNGTEQRTPRTETQSRTNDTRNEPRNGSRNETRTETRTDNRNNSRTTEQNQPQKRRDNSHLPDIF